VANIEKGVNPGTVRWTAPTENVDGTPVNGPLNYNLYRSDNENISKETDFFYIVVGTLVGENQYEAPLDNFPDGRNVIALTAIDIDGDESALSNTVGFTVTDGVAPLPPVLEAS